MMLDVEVVVSTCDRYHAAWGPFCHGINKYWPDRPWPVSFLTNHLDPPCGRALKVGDDPGWSRMQRMGLEQLNAEAVLLTHEDLWLTAPVETAALIDFADIVLRGDADKVLLTRGTHTNEGVYKPDPRLNVHAAHSRWRTATHGLWRVSTLLSLLKDGETPWEFETKGNKRSFDPSLVFLSVRDDVYYPHIPPPGALKRGKWKIAARRYAAREGIISDGWEGAI